jgi:lipoprotein LprG
MSALHSAHLEQRTKGSIPGWPVITLSGDLTNLPGNAFTGFVKMNLQGEVVDAELVALDGMADSSQRRNGTVVRLVR